MGRGAVAADEAVQGDTGRKVFQNEEPGRYIGGDNARGKGQSQITGQELQRGQFGTQPPGYGACLGGASPYPFHDNRPGSASPPEQHPRDRPGLKTLPAVDGVPVRGTDPSGGLAPRRGGRSPRKQASPQNIALARQR